MKPIIDLHLHLDGSLSVKCVNSLMALDSERVPEEYKYLLDMEDDKRLAALEKVLRVPEPCLSLADYLTKFDLPCALLQTPEAMQLAVGDLLQNLEAEGVKYVEVRFAPQLHSQGIKDEFKRYWYEEKIVKAMLEKTAEFSNIKCNFILCMMRNLPEAKESEYNPNMNTLRLADNFLNKGVVAVDLAGAEARDATSEFRWAFDFAQEMKIPFTIHAGEAGALQWRLDSLKSAIEFGTCRIGHGIALENAPELRKICKDAGIGIECCPVSNLQTKAVCGGIHEHPLPMFMQEGLLVSVNTDNRTVSNTNLQKEFKLLSEIGIGEVEQKVLTMNAIESSFANEQMKKWLRTLV